MSMMVQSGRFAGELSISGTPITTATEDVAYTGFTVSATGGVLPYVFSVQSGSLPAGITLNSSTGAVSGTPTTAGIETGIVIRVTDAAMATDDLASFDIDVDAGEDPAFANVVLLVGFDGADASTTATDDSYSAHTLTFNGNAQIDTAQSKFGGASLLLDGTGDYVSIPHSADFIFTGDFTIRFFVRRTAGTATQYMLSKSDEASAKSFLMSFGGVSFTAQLSTNGSAVTTLASTTNPNNSTWYHLQLERAGTTVRLFLDGVMEDSDTVSGSLFNNSSVGLQIGSYSGAGGGLFGGHIEELEIRNGEALNGVDTSFTVPTSAYPRP